jgi:hypothetical protein
MPIVTEDRRVILTTHFPLPFWTWSWSPTQTFFTAEADLIGALGCICLNVESGSLLPKYEKDYRHRAAEEPQSGEHSSGWRVRLWTG